MLLRQRVEVWGLLGIDLYQSHGKRTPGMLCLVALCGLRVVIPADRQEIKGEKIPLGELRKVPRCLLQLSS